MDFMENHLMTRPDMAEIEPDNTPRQPVHPPARMLVLVLVICAAVILCGIAIAIAHVLPLLWPLS